MNDKYKVYLGVKMPKLIDSVNKTNEGYLIEYDGWHFEAKTLKATINQVLRYIFKGGEEK